VIAVVGMLGSALAMIAATLVAGMVLGAGLKLLPTVRLQLAGLAALAVCLPLAVVLLSGWVMFHMGADVMILAVSVASAAAAVVVALWLARSIAAPIETVRQASAQLAGGDLAARAPEAGPAEVAELAAAFNEMADHLQRLFDARRELVAWASHDLRAPLANMQALLEATSDGLMETTEALPRLEEQVRGLAILVDDLFELARIDSGALQLELHDAPLAGVVASSLRGVEAEARLRRITLAAAVDSTVSVRFAEREIERVLLNLLANALRHTPSDGSIAVHVQPDPAGAGVSIVVEDTGTGLGPAASARMFDRFWRADPARSERGAGLGLAIARGLVEAHGGRIWAEERPGGGARVGFTLPAAPVSVAR
jgi:signal transduction histidine kinase